MLVNSSSSSSSHSCSWEWDRCVTPEWPRRTAHLHRSAGKRRLLSERIRSNHLLLGRPGRRFHVRSNSYLLVTKYRHSTQRDGASSNTSLYRCGWPAGAKMRPSGGRKSSQNAGARGRNRGGSSSRGGVGADMHSYHLGAKLSLDDISNLRLALYT